MNYFGNYLKDCYNSLFTDNYQLFYKAVEENNIDNVKELLQKGINVKSNNSHCVSIACRHGHLQLLKFLLSKGAEANEYNVLTAAENNQFDIVMYIIQNELIQNENNESVFSNYILNRCLSWSVFYNNMEMVKYFIEKGAHPFEDRFHPFSFAIGKRHHKILEYLISKTNYILPFAVIGDAISWGRLETVKYLIENTKDRTEFANNWSRYYYQFELTQSYDERIQEYFETACRCDKVDIAKYFVTLGANPYGHHRLFYDCVHWQRLSTLKYFVSLGYDIHYDNDKLMRYKYFPNNHKHIEILQYLVDQGANVDLIEDTELRKQMEYYQKYKIVMDSCIAQIHYNPRLERTKTEQLEMLKEYKKLKIN